MFYFIDYISNRNFFKESSEYSFSGSFVKQNSLSICIYVFIWTLKLYKNTAKSYKSFYRCQNSES